MRRYLAACATLTAVKVDSLDVQSVADLPARKVVGTGSEMSIEVEMVAPCCFGRASAPLGARGVECRLVHTILLVAMSGCQYLIR